MLVGILFQLPSGLSNGGILSFAATTQSDTATTYTSGFQGEPRPVKGVGCQADPPGIQSLNSSSVSRWV